MSSKPTTLPEWDTNLTNVTTATSDEMDDGFPLNAKPTSGVVNWLFAWIYFWLKYLSDGDLQGPITIRTLDEDTHTPLLTGLDPGTGDPRATIDHMGYRGGPVSEFVQAWETSGTTEPLGWTFSSTNGTRAYNDPSSGSLPWRHVQLDVPATVNSNADLVSLPFAYVDADRTLKVEWDVRTGSSIDTGTSMIYLGEIQFSHAAAWDSAVGFSFNRDTSVNIQTKIDATTSDPSVAVVMAVDTNYRLRVEISGANMHDASNFLARFFIDDVLVRESTFSAPAADAVRHHQRLSNGNPATAYRVYVGPIRYSFNHPGV